MAMQFNSKTLLLQNLHSLVTILTRAKILLRQTESMEHLGENVTQPCKVNCTPILFGTCNRENWSRQPCHIVIPFQSMVTE